LKIDKLFIKDLDKDSESVAIVKAIIAMAKSLNKTIIAEGVETIEQLNILKDLDCDIAQGYFISKPKLAKDVMDYSKTAIIHLEDFRKSTSTSNP
jgi:EAL domain-containing protein (putative c-di-GMP-specific phosphodiesterase class I)